MPQMFQVLRCYKCLVFQVHQCKKSNKFECKMCGEKQSIKRHYGLGNGQECRKHVQKLNNIRGELDQSQNNYDSDNDCSESDDIPQHVSSKTECQKNSKWSDYVDEEVLAIPNPTNEVMYLNDTEVVLELPKKRHKMLGVVPKKRNNNKGNLSNSDVKEAEVNTKNLESVENINPSFHDEPPKETFENKEYEFSDVDSFISSHRKPVSNFNLPQSKPTRYSNYESEKQALTIESKRNLSDAQQKVIKKKFIPPVVKKDSKWAKFANVTDEDREELSNEEEEGEVRLLNKNSFDCYKPIMDYNRPSESCEASAYQNNKAKKSDHQVLFSLCDEDDDFDKYLDI